MYMCILCSSLVSPVVSFPLDLSNVCIQELAQSMLRSGVSTSMPTRCEQNARENFPEEHVTELTEPLVQYSAI